MRQARSVFLSRETHEEVLRLIQVIESYLSQDIIGLRQFQAALVKLQPLYRATPNVVWEREFDLTPCQFVLWHSGKWPDFSSYKQNQQAMRGRLQLIIRMLKADFGLKE